MKPGRIFTGAGVVAALVLHLLPLVRDIRWRRTAGSPRFAVPTTRAAGRTNEAPRFREERLGPGPGVASVHVASLCEFAPGQLAVAWYGGSREGARDVAIYLSQSTAGDRAGWTDPVAIVTTASAQSELNRYVRKVGNALVFADPGGRLRLLYVSIAVGGWSGSSLNLKESMDGGQSWTPSRRLALSPFFNVSELVKNQPAPLANGGWVVPIYQELFGKFPELLWLQDPSASASPRRTRVFGGRTAFQPALVAFDADRALLLCRTAGSRREIFCSRTDDAGAHWSAPESCGLPNPDSGIAAIRLSDGRLLLAFNDSTTNRDNLRLAVSEDSGATWGRAATVASEAGAEFSYPFLLQTGDGLVHLVYTWKRQAIQHVVFNTAWLDAPRTEAGR
jgi:predicted neuraminidase